MYIHTISVTVVNTTKHFRQPVIIGVLTGKSRKRALVVAQEKLLKEYPLTDGYEYQNLQVLDREQVPIFML